MADYVVGLDPIFCKDGMAHREIVNVPFHNQEVNSVDRCASVVGEMHCAPSDVHANNIPYHMEMDRISAHLESLTSVENFNIGESPKD